MFLRNLYLQYSLKSIVNLQIKKYMEVINFLDEPLTLEGIKGRRERRADTNVISINFSNLVTPGHMFTGDPVYCADCKSLLSNISKINKDEDQQVSSDWLIPVCMQSMFICI